ncbi:hypothetical protein MTO96_008250 [Rhipicephalus appendiculatus]
MTVNNVTWSGFKPACTSQQFCHHADRADAQLVFGTSAPAIHIRSFVFQLRRYWSPVTSLHPAENTSNDQSGRETSRDDRSHGTGTTSPRQVNCFLHSMGGTLAIVSSSVNNRPVRVCIDSGANISIMSALSAGIPTHAGVSREKIEVLNRSIRPTRAATLDVTFGTTNVLLREVVVTELPSRIDLILGSDWRRVANADATFHTSNDVTIVPVEPTEQPEVAPPKRNAPRRTGEALIASFCLQSNMSVFEDDGFVRPMTTSRSW